MITSHDCLHHYGLPTLERNMVLWDVPHELEIGVIPRRIYCNKDLVRPLTDAFGLLVSHGLANDLKSWDGCFNIRKSKAGHSYSLHSWGLAIDVDAAWNGFDREPKIDPDIVRCFEAAGFEWGGRWTVPDGMHFQLARLPEA